MAKCNLNGVTVEEINRNSANAYAAGIDSGEIQKVVCRHSKKGNVVLSIEGKALYCKAFDGSNFTADGCILYNPPLIKAIIEACDNSDASIFIVKGAVTTTAPKTTTSDTVRSKEELQKEKAELEKGYFGLKGEEQKAAKSRIDAIEALLKTA
jgi:hypothetical protein